VVLAVVEEKDADEAQRGIKEINAGIYVFDGRFLEDALSRVTDDNAGGEYYLTDVPGIAAQDGRRVAAHLLADVAQTEGANDRVQLAALAAELNRRTLERWMRAGVTVVDPGSTWVDVTVTLEPDTTLLPGVQLLGATSVSEGAVVGPDSTLEDTVVGAGATVVRSHGLQSVIGPRATVGPFCYLRPGTQLGDGAKLGTFVEAKNARLGSGAKVPHLSYVGDAEVGEGSNIGAGTIFANYDGVAKHRTVVGRHARTGSNNTFIAPVSIGDGAFTGGGTVVRRDVPPGALAVSAGPQRVLEGWVLRNRAGTSSAAAAEEAASHASVGDVAAQPDA
jgi:bifunctional UDP-N-acetylglucosamine pyrophosphorylase/glucosamine-1-phosphate N-acetyltransferase